MTYQFEIERENALMKQELKELKFKMSLFDNFLNSLLKADIREKRLEELEIENKSLRRKIYRLQNPEVEMPKRQWEQDLDDAVKLSLI